MPHYYMFYKPFGCVTARRDDRYPTVMDYFMELHNDRLSPVGRLDRETTGLLLITDDGIFNQKLTHPSYHKEKTYEFTLLGDLTPDLVHKLETGVILKIITISEGKKRQIRRMMKSVHCCVIELKRISIGDIVLDEALCPGEWQEIFPHT